MADYKLLTVGHDAKTVKGEKRGYLTGILYLAPWTLSGRNLCPNASPGCIATCLYTAGRGGLDNVQAGRLRKAHMFLRERSEFMRLLVRDIQCLTREAGRKGFAPVVRLNGTSDIPWENVTVDSDLTGHVRNVMAAFPEVTFYDYTKSARRMASMLHGKVNMVESLDWPANYHLTFSRSECNEQDTLAVLAFGGNVAVVFDTPKGQSLPTRWQDYEVIDGDTSDLRFLDYSPVFQAQPWPRGARAYGLVIGLRAKGKARKDTSGFVVQS